MPKLYSARVVITALQRAGFVNISQKGSHIKLTKSLGKETLTVIIPNHKEIARGTFGSILKQANLTKEEFEKLVK
jgi:predicted RNA binding protein YcfA (HicA-like mRNA interferase family)